MENIGWKTIAVAVAMILLAVASFIGVDVSAITSLTPGDLVMGALALLGLRFGIAKAIPK